MDAAQLVQALSVAWGGVHLYPDPKEVPAFLKAVETIGSFAGAGLVLGVTVDGFVAGAEPVPNPQSSGKRLAGALFAAEVASLTIAAPPTADEIITFVRQLEDGERIADTEFDFPARLQLAGVDAIRVRCHDLLEDRAAGDEGLASAESEVPRDPAVQDLFESDSVDRLAERFLAGGAPHVVASEFVAAYRSTYQKVAAGDPAGLERVVRTFVDAFCRLDSASRAAVFQEVVAAPDDTPFQNFLDQFSADELAKLAGEADAAALPLLVEYARVVAEMQGRDPGLVEQLAAENADRARQGVASSVGAHLTHFLEGDDAHEGAVASLAEEVAGLEEQGRIGWLILADLFAIEDREERTRRLLRIWVAKLSAAIKSGSFEQALQWLAVAHDAGVDPSGLDAAFGQVASNDVMAILTRQGPDRESRDQLLVELSKRSAGQVLDQLAIEEDPGRRRMLIDIVSEIARVDVRSVLSGLEDPRWYVVRNLVIALGKSGRKAAGEPLARLSGHDDHRVRIEALRALIPCVGPAAADHLVRALADDHVRVRAAAADLLGVLDREVAVAALTAAVRDESIPLERRVAAIEILGAFPSEEGRRIIEQVAATSGRFSHAGRALRSAAREVLRSTGHA